MISAWILMLCVTADHGGGCTSTSEMPKRACVAAMEELTERDLMAFCLDRRTGELMWDDD